MKYKEGKDFEWVPMKDKDGKVVKDGRGGAVKTRRFFTKAEKEAMKSGDKPKAKAESKAPSSAPKSTSKRPQARRTDTKALSKPPAVEERNLSSTKGGRGDGVAEMARRALDRPQTSSSANPKAEQAKTKLLRSAGINYETWEEMTRPERRKVGLPETTVGWQNQSLINDPLGWMKKQLGLTARTPSTGSAGMAKGGMVKSGNKDYKKSGMFYKSGSPRGYK
jgi:hypothetical protein